MLFSRKNKQYATEILVRLNSKLGYNLLSIEMINLIQIIDVLIPLPRVIYASFSYICYLKNIFDKQTLNVRMPARNKVCNVILFILATLIWF